MYEAMLEDQSKIDVGWKDPESGAYYTEAPIEEDSPAMQKFRNLGLPSPFAAYNDPEYLKMAYDTMAPNLGPELAQREQNIVGTQAAQDRIARETRGPIDRNIALQAEYAKSLRPRVPPPATPARLPTPRAAPSGLDEFGAQVAAGAPAYGPPVQTPPAAFKLPPSTEPWVVGNAKYGYQTAPSERDAQVRALANRAMNFNFGLGGGNRPTETEPLSKTVAAYSQKGADEARKKFAVANANRYQASQATPQSLGQAARALAMANFQAERGVTPFIDAYRQRLLGQRAMGA
jgi:hypothetical protein